jgi:hypothetical protein
LLAAATLPAAAARLGADFRLLAPAFLFFRAVVLVALLVLVVLVFRNRAFGRLAERRFAGDFLLAFALLLPRRAARLAMVGSLSVTLTVLR